MIDELRLPALAAGALTLWLLCALGQQRRGRSTTPRLIWRQRACEKWSGWYRLRGGPILDSAVEDLTRQCGLDGDTAWPDSTNVAYHQLLNAALSRSRPAPVAAVQFAIVRTPRSAPDYTLDVLFVSPVHERTRGTALTVP
ncbi:hypothetical protein BH09ACT7_BH09ACT7_35330 [soil metagenome]